MFTTLLGFLLQATVDLGVIAQIINYLLLIVNSVYTILIVPTYRDYKLMLEDYRSRTSPTAIAALKELKDKEKDELKEIISALKDVKHDLAQLRQGAYNLTPVFRDIEEIHKSINELAKHNK